MSPWHPRRALDSWFPTAARYTGLALIAVGVATLFVGQPHPELCTAGVGLALIKSITDESRKR